jgi:pimeloyl-ACP methyl ester carboxylesterase
MAKLRSNGLELEHDTFGDPAARPVLLIMGLGTQMIAWDEEFCEALVDRGHYVIRFDNRDIGLSSKLDEHPPPSLLEMMPKVLAGEAVEVPYSLSDMADDAIGVLDALEIDSAHVVGASMGGMIAQCVALQARKRVRSLTSIMSTTGRRDLPPAKPEAMLLLMTPPPTDREGLIEHRLMTHRVIGSPAFAFDEARARERAARAVDRSSHLAGSVRQTAAIVASPPRDAALRTLDLPTLVIHGDADPLVPVEAGLDTHACIANSEMMLIEGMGHDLPMDVWPQIIEGITKLTGQETSRG